MGAGCHSWRVGRGRGAENLPQRNETSHKLRLDSTEHQPAREHETPGVLVYLCSLGVCGCVWACVCVYLAAGGSCCPG